MHSSTFSSSERAPRGRWAATWVTVLLLLVVALSAWKSYWTAQGFGISVTNDVRSWAAARTHLRDDSAVLVGTSRIQAAIDPDAWADAVGGDPPLQLALVGSTPLPVMRHLAMDTSFHGLAVVGIVEMYMFNAEPGNRRGDDAIAEYRALMTSPARRAGVVLDRLLPQSFLVRHRRLSFAGILEAMWEGHAPINPPANMQRNRWMEFEGSRLEPDDFDYSEFETLGRPASAAERDAIIDELDGYIETIQNRGGRVVLVAFPACGQRRGIEARRYPRNEYWDPLAARTPAETINAYDVPELMHFSCADGSHLDAADAQRFSQVLARIVRGTD